MSFIHYLYIGHFGHDRNFVRFQNTPTDPILKPVVCRPLDMNVVQRLAHEAAMTDTNQSLVPDDWEMWVKDGYLICDRYALSPQAIDFIHRLVRATGCEVVDFNARSPIQPEMLIPTRVTPKEASVPVTPSHP